ncbi:hypothetical protein [Pseudomonas sp. NKUCC02_KPG]|uniref:zinc finger domain-containing protein n=1 Tax=Pseudomonas sp. NKUCC02_KPG TaxID=2842124 RepID=UPI001C5BF950|nr:hypothetical protein [Pseudomonas sp. NKUCC02_KPG]
MEIIVPPGVESVRCSRCQTSTARKSTGFGFFKNTFTSPLGCERQAVSAGAQHTQFDEP